MFGVPPVVPHTPCSQRSARKSPTRGIRRPKTNLLPMRIRLTAAAAALVVAASSVASAASPSEPTSRLVVKMDRLSYLDGTAHARFGVTGMCLPTTDNRAFEHRSCDGASGVLRQAVLGFDASRRSQAVVSADPEVHTSEVVEGEQVELVTVRLRREGELKVVVAARPSSIAARPVKDSSDPPAKVKGRSVTWKVRNAKPDVCTFAVRFTVRSSRPAPGRYLPETTVSLSRRSDGVLSSVGAPTHHENSSEESTLVLAQHEVPNYGSPQMTVGRTYTTAPYAWVTTAHYEAEGNYQVATGQVSAAVRRSVDNLAPGELEMPNAGSIGYAQSYPSTGPKVEPIADFSYRRSSISGLIFGIQTADPSIDLPFGSPLAGTIFDGDSASAVVSASLCRLSTDSKRAPRGPAGKLEALWGGDYSQDWGVFDQSATPDRRSLPPSSVLQREALIPVVARSGDIDNRRGDRAVKGEPVRITFPDGEFGVAIIFVIGPSQSKLDLRTRFTREGVLVLTPVIDQGGYMLESHGAGFARDWAGYLMVSVSVFEPRRQEPPQESLVERTLVVPAGATAQLTVVDIEERTTRRFSLGAGAWRAGAGADRRVSVKRT